MPGRSQPGSPTVVTKQPVGRDFSGSETTALAGAFGTKVIGFGGPPAAGGDKAPPSKLIGSERRGFKLMQVVPEPDPNDDDDGDGKTPKKVLVVKSKYGKTRPLNAEGVFADRPKPVGEPSLAVERHEASRRWAEAEAAKAKQDALREELSRLESLEAAERKADADAEAAERMALAAWASKETTDADLPPDDDAPKRSLAGSRPGTADLFGGGGGKTPKNAQEVAAEKARASGGRPASRDGKKVAQQAAAKAKMIRELKAEAEAKASATAMPFLYASDKAGVVLTRGQYLDLAEAKERQRVREAKRAADAAVEKAMVEAWMCDPRMLPGWTVHFSAKHAKCYFVNNETGETIWKPPGKWPEARPETPPPTPPPPRVPPIYVRATRAVCRATCIPLYNKLPPPPRWWRATKRSVRMCCKGCGCGCILTTKPVDIGKGPAADEAREIIEALGLLEDDVNKIWEAFQDADWDGGGELSTEELFAWFGEPVTAFSRTIFRLADMDDSGMLDFPEFIKVVCSYSAFQEDDILKFGFDLFDEDGSGTIDEYELKKLVEKINGAGDDKDDENETHNGNLMKALKAIDKEGDGILDFFEFVKLCKHMPLILYPAFRLQKVIQKKTLGEARWGFVLWNLNRTKRVTEYMATHHGRRPAGDFKAATRVTLETMCGCCGWPRLPETFPEYVDGIRPASAMRATGAYGGGFEKRKAVDLSQFTPPSF